MGYIFYNERYGQQQKAMPMSELVNKFLTEKIESLQKTVDTLQLEKEQMIIQNRSLVAGHDKKIEEINAYYHDMLNVALEHIEQHGNLVGLLEQCKNNNTPANYAMGVTLYNKFGNTKDKVLQKALDDFAPVY